MARTRVRTRRNRARARPRRIMVSVVMMMMGWGRLRAWSRLRAWTRPVAVGPEHVAGRYAVGAAPEFGSRASAHILWIVRGWFRFVAATRIRL